MPETVRQIFLSSTARDLFAHREAVREALARLSGWHVIAMENFGARDAAADEFCREEVKRCDLFIGLVGECYGSSRRDDPDGPSFSAREYDTAEEHQRPRLIFLTGDQFVPPNKFREPDAKWERQQAFRKRLSGDRIVDFFEQADVLAARVVTAVREWEVQHPVADTAPAVERWYRPPYPGLVPFTEDDAPIFFGRKPHTDKLVQRIADEGEAFTAIVGISGSGKSSLMVAGVLPVLKARGWRTVVFRPTNLGSDPRLALATKLQPLVQPTARPVDLVTRWQQSQDAWAADLEAARGDAPGLLLAIDQAEELLTPQIDDAQPFLELVERAAPTAAVLLTLRADFVATAIATPPLDRLLQYNQHTLGLPPPHMLAAVIREPAARARLKVEDDLVGALVCDVGNDPGALALLAFTLQQLWLRDHESGGLRLATYAQPPEQGGLGGLKGALGAHCKAVAEALDEEPALGDWRALLKRLFARAVQVTPDEDGNRRLAKQRFRVDDDAALATLAERLCAQRLLTNVDDRSGRLELAHETLLEAWPDLAAWLKTQRAWLELRDDLRRDRQRWLEQNREPGYLWSHERVREVVTALARLGDDGGLDDDDRAFLGPIDRQRMLAAIDRPETKHAERALIGERLAVLGDPRAGVGVADGTPVISWCDVPAGEVSIDAEGEAVSRTVEAFSIAAYPVTVVQYQAFLHAADGWRDDRWWHGLDRASEDYYYDFGRFASHPAVYVSWYDATAFCRWLSHRRGEEVRLPTEWEWQQAATSGMTEHAFPWGADWDPKAEPWRANTSESRLGRATAVGLYPAGRSPVGALDIAGNVVEWCVNKYHHPEVCEPRPNDLDLRVLRGGSWRYDQDHARCAYRSYGRPDVRYSNFGFRVVSSSPIVTADP